VTKVRPEEVLLPLSGKKGQDEIKEFEERLEADCQRVRELDKLKPRISDEWIRRLQQMFTKRIKALKKS
jgi:hypothetical protein